MSTQGKVTSAAMAARGVAVRRLIEESEGRFEEILAEERKARGLFPKIKRVTIAEMREELAKAHAEIQRLGGGQHNQ